MNKKKLLIVILILVVLSCLLFIFIDKDNSKVTEGVDSIDINIDLDNGDENIDWRKYETTNIDLNKSITINDGGIYIITGIINDGLIRVDTEDEVKLILNNISIKNSSGPAIYIENANDVVIELLDGTNNYLEDGKNYTDYEIDVIGTIYSHDDITFEGNGSLEIVSNNEDAIVGKDDLKIVSGTYKITSADDGIRGKDSVYIKNGNFTINSTGDGIKSTNDTDSEKGFILIENGEFDITSTLDGISSSTKLLIEDGTFNITSGDGSKNVSTSDFWGHWGSSNNENSKSAKGIKSGDNLVIKNGSFILDTSDDAIHCNNYVGIKNGSISITSGDDGIHADSELIIDGGTINMTKSYEGLEAAKVTINNGNINVISTDDGINIAGGNDSSANNRPGSNNYSQNSDNILTINGGNIYVNASGDGIDVNGNAYINGGNIKVYGPVNNANGTLDYDGIFEVNGGTLIAGGSSGMLKGCSSSSKIYSTTVVFNSTYSSEDIITIVDSSNKEIISYKSNKSFSALVVASPDLKKGETYKIKVNDREYESFTISNITTTIGNYGAGGKGNRPND